MSSINWFDIRTFGATNKADKPLEGSQYLESVPKGLSLYCPEAIDLGRFVSGAFNLGQFRAFSL